MGKSDAPEQTSLLLDPDELGSETEVPEARAEPAAREESDERDAEIQQLRQQLEQSQQGESTARRQLNDTLERLVTGADLKPQAEETAALPPMPDPATDPEGFQKWMQGVAQSTRSEATRAVSEIRSEMSDRELRDRLWTEFQSEYPQYRGLDEAARMAFLMETDGTGRVSGDAPDLKRRVARRLEALQKQLGGKAETVTRTEGVSAGSDASPTPPAPVVEPETTHTLSRLLAEQQEQSGYF